MPYSVSPRRKLNTVGLNPSWNFSTRMPSALGRQEVSELVHEHQHAEDEREGRQSRQHQIPQSSNCTPRAASPRILAGPRVHGAHGRQRRRPPTGRCARHRPLDHVRDRREAEPPLEKPRDRHFVRRVQHHRQAALRLERAIREPQARERVRVGRVEIEPPRPREIERRQRRRPPLRIRERVLDRQPHVGDAELRDHRPVDELDHRVHDRLRVDDHVDLSRRRRRTASAPRSPRGPCSSASPSRS